MCKLFTSLHIKELFIIYEYKLPILENLTHTFLSSLLLETDMLRVFALRREMKSYNCISWWTEYWSSFRFLFTDTYKIRNGITKSVKFISKFTKTLYNETSTQWNLENLSYSVTEIKHNNINKCLIRIV